MFDKITTGIGGATTDTTTTPEHYNVGEYTAANFAGC